MHRPLLGEDAAEVPPSGAAVDGGVAVEHLFPAQALRDADAEAAARHRREVAHTEDGTRPVAAVAQEADDALVVVVAVDPLEAGRIVVQLVQRRLLAIQAVEVGHPLLDPAVLRELQQVPVERGVVVPLAILPELAPHEEELLPGLSILVAEQQAQVGALLPVVAGHLVDQRSLAVHHLVVRDSGARSSRRRRTSSGR